MVVKTLYYVFTILLLVVFFLLVQEPYFLDSKNSATNIAKIEMENIKDFEISEKKIIRESSAKKVVRYKDKDVFNHIEMNFVQEDFIYSVKSNKGEYKKDIITLNENVNIERNDGLKFTTELINYDVKNKIFWGDDPFTYTSKFLNANGYGLVYDVKNKDIKSNKIHAIYKLEKKWDFL